MPVGARELAVAKDRLARLGQHQPPAADRSSCTDRTCGRRCATAAGSTAGFRRPVAPTASVIAMALATRFRWVSITPRGVAGGAGGVEDRGQVVGAGRRRRSADGVGVAGRSACRGARRPASLGLSRDPRAARPPVCVLDEHHAWPRSGRSAQPPAVRPAPRAAAHGRRRRSGSPDRRRSSRAIGADLGDPVARADAASRQVQPPTPRRRRPARSQDRQVEPAALDRRPGPAGRPDAATVAANSSGIVCVFGAVGRHGPLIVATTLRSSGAF